MAARLTGVQYEILLERAWVEDGIARYRKRTATASGEPSPAGVAPASEPARSSRFPIAILRRHRGIGAGYIVALAVAGVVGAAAIFLIVRPGLGSNGTSNDTNVLAAPLATATASLETLPGATGEQQVEDENGSVDGGNSDGPPSTDGQAATPQPLILNPAMPATYAGGLEVRIVAKATQVSTTFARSPASGFHFVGLQVQICGGAIPVESGPDNWFLELPDGSYIEAVEPIAEPPLKAARLARGACSTGWITFEAPLNRDPQHVVFRHPDYERIRFRW